MSSFILLFFGFSFFVLERVHSQEVSSSLNSNPQLYQYERRIPDGSAGSPPTRVVKATADIIGQSPISGRISGSINFTEPYAGANSLMIVGRISGLKPGFHGIKIEAFANPNGGCSVLGEAFNPAALFPTQSFLSDMAGDLEYKPGDLGNILAGNNSEAYLKISSNFLTLNGPSSIVGRMVVIYEEHDDYPTPGLMFNASHVSRTRIACGIIGIMTEINGQELAANMTFLAANARINASLAAMPNATWPRMNGQGQAGPNPMAPAGAAAGISGSNSYANNYNRPGGPMGAGARLSVNWNLIVAALLAMLPVLFL